MKSNVERIQIKFFARMKAAVYFWLIPFFAKRCGRQFIRNSQKLQLQSPISRVLRSAHRARYLKIWLPPTLQSTSTTTQTIHSMSFTLLRVLLLCSLIISTIFLYFSVFLTDACYTVPCLSSEYSVNFLRVSVSASVSAVVFGAVNVLAPSGALYLIYFKCKSFSAGVLNGAYVVVSLAAWIQAITWGEQYSNLHHTTSNSILMFGGIYEINKALRSNSFTMCILCTLSAILNTALTLCLLRMRGLYCVDYQNQIRRTGPNYHQYSTVSVSDNSDRRDDESVLNEVSI